MWRKIVGCFALGSFLILIGMYIAGSINLVNKHAEIFDKYPTVFVGVGAAFVALLGVIISQIWQTANMNKNIQTNKENLEKQLDKQQETLQKQFSEQRDLLAKQNEHALELEDKKLEAARIDKKYEEFEDDKKEFYFHVIELREKINRLLKCRVLSANAVIKIDVLLKLPVGLKLPKNNIVKEDNDNLLEKEEELEKEYLNIITTLKYLHNFKKIGYAFVFEYYFFRLRQFESFDRDINEIIKESKDYPFGKGINPNYFKEYQDHNAIFNQKLSDVQKQFSAFYNGDFYSAQKQLLSSVQNQKLG